MSLHRHKARNRPGGAEVICASLVGLAVAGIAVAGLSPSSSNWVVTQGSVDGVRYYEPASTALATSQLVRVEYRYVVNGVSYRSVWDGSWPRSYSPNALSGPALRDLSDPGYSLFVWFDPAEPSRSRLHGGRGSGDVIWRRLVLGGALVIWLVVLRAYPGLKARMRAAY